MAKASRPTEPKKERTTIFIEPKMLEQLRYIAYKENVTRTDIVLDALAEHIARYEKKNGAIPVK